jgi:catalase
VGATLGEVQSTDGEALQVEISIHTAPSAVWDAVVLPDGEAAAQALSRIGQALEFVRDQYRHCKPILALRAGASLLTKAGIPGAQPSGKQDPGLLRLDGENVDAAVAAFAEALAKHGHFERETDPPMI